MRYAVYITRADQWCFQSRERVPISETEWLNYAKRDPELRLLKSMPCVELASGRMRKSLAVAKVLNAKVISDDEKIVEDESDASNRLPANPHHFLT
jgi:hypothetical protein